MLLNLSNPEEVRSAILINKYHNQKRLNETELATLRKEGARAGRRPTTSGQGASDEDLVDKTPVYSPYAANLSATANRQNEASQGQSAGGGESEEVSPAMNQSAVKMLGNQQNQVDWSYRVDDDKSGSETPATPAQGQEPASGFLPSIHGNAGNAGGGRQQQF